MDFKYTTTNISVLEYRITEKDNGFSIPGDACRVGGSINLYFNSDKEEVVYHYVVRYIDKRNEEELMFFHSKMVFRILDFNKVLGRIKGEITVTEPFLVNFVNIVTGAARGMLAMLNKGTYLNNIYLPINNNLEVLDALRNQLFKK